MSALPVASETDRWLARDRASLAGVLPRYYDVVAARGEGSWIVDVEGRRYLDFGSGIGVTNIGHCHPRVVDAIQRQAATLIHTSVVVHHRLNIELAERMAGLVPWMDDAQVFFANSGAEAVDGSVKLARKATGRPGVVAFDRAFHGRTLAATSLTTAKPKYRDGYGPLLPGVVHAPYCTDGDVAAALVALDRLVRADDVGMMIVEPVLGEGGYVVPPAAWLAGLRDRCDNMGALLVFDEVQTGIGRTGAPFASDLFGVRPDVVLFAKGVASGLPLAGIIAPRRLMDRWPTGTHGSTFGGNPIACAAALATLDVLEEGGLFDRCRRLGERALAQLTPLAAARPDAVRDVRGMGLMIGIELRDGAAATAVRAECLRRGLIVLSCGPDDSVIRLIPPLTISDEELADGLGTLGEVITTLNLEVTRDGRGLAGTHRPALTV